MSRTMRIGMILDSTFPPDPRVANEARSLVQAGHEVHLLCLRHTTDQPEREDWHSVHLHRVRIGRSFYRKASAVSLELPFYRLRLRGPLERMIRQERIEVLHAHDLPMVSEAVRAARRASIPVVADLHENWPAALKTYAYAQTPLGRLLISPSRWAQHERSILPRVDRIVVVVGEARDRLAKSGIERDRITVVQNTVSIDEFVRFGIDETIRSRFEDRFVLCYLGGFDRHRGLEMAVDAMPTILERIPKALLLLIGTGATERELRDRVTRSGLDEAVRFEGWQPFERFPSYIGASAIGLIPHVKNEHTDTTIPHKLFHYMLLERPVVTTDCRPLQRIVEETGSGLVVRSGDAADLARAVIRLEDEGLREAMGRAGRQAVEEQYRWDRDAQRLLDLYERLPAGGAR